MTSKYISLTSYFGFFPAINPMILISNNLLNLRLPSPIQGSNVRRWSLITNLHTPSTVKQPHPASSLLLEVRSRRYTIQEAKQFHSYIVKLGSSSNIYLVNSLIHVYVINGDLDDARKLFDGMLHRDVVSWTTLVDGYCKFGKMCHAQELFDLMPERNIVSWNVLLSGYGKYGDVEAARMIFNEMPERDTVSWNSLISSYARNGFAKEAFELFRDALVQDAIKPNRVTLLSVLPAIAESGYSFWGKCVHCIIIKAGIEVDGVLCSALVDMYSKCDCLDMAFQEFKSSPSRGNVASWNPMLAGLVRNNMFEEALDLFRTMQLENIEPDDVTLVSVLPAISYLGALSLGKWIHSYIRKNNFRINAALGSALVDMYSKCGCIDLALPVFAAVEEKSIELWNAMIQGLGTHGRGKDALKLFSQMQEKKLEFDDVTFAAVLNACSHSGLVDEGLSFFAAMKDIHKRTPNIQHYGCMVDLLGRAGRLEEAKDLICNKMAIKPDVVIWKSLLGACKIHGNVEIGEFAARNLSELHPTDSSSYVLMSSLYEAAGRSNDAIATRKDMRDGGVKKEPGFSLIESRGMVHKFLVGDKSHPRAREIYTMLDEMVGKAKKVGYIPNKKLVLFDITDEEKESAVSHHGEKLAVAFGLIDSDRGAPFRIVKNLRMCSDCHVFLKLVSKIYDRQIVVRDHSRFHHFMKGNCSCMDYW